MLLSKCCSSIEREGDRLRPPDLPARDLDLLRRKEGVKMTADRLRPLRHAALHAALDIWRI